MSEELRFIGMKAKNFLSIGNDGQQFEFEEGKIVVFKGNIGAGKSLVLDAFSVLLFGKTYSKKNIGDIVNRTNRRNCELELSFELKGNLYTIKRGYKPDYESLEKNGKDLPISGKEGLNKTIEQLLSIDRKIFDQTVFLSGRYFSPFMEFGAEEKRTFIKKIFDLEKYEIMKELVNKEKKEKEEERIQIETKFQMLKELLKKEQETNEARKESVYGAIDILEANNKNLERQMKEHEILIAENEEFLKSYQEILDKKNRVFIDIEYKEKEFKEEKRKEKLLEEKIRSKKEIQKQLEEIVIEISKLKIKTIEEYNDLKEKIVKSNAEMNFCKENLNSLEKEIFDLTSNISKIEAKLKNSMELSKELESVLNGESIDNIRKFKDEIQESIDVLRAKKNECENFMKTKTNQIEILKFKLETENSKLDSVSSNINYVENNEVCESCGSELKEEAKERIFRDLKQKIEFHENNISAIEKEISDLDKKKKSAEKSYSSLLAVLSERELEIKQMKNRIEKILFLQSKMKEKDYDNLKNEKLKLEDFLEDKKKLFSVASESYRVLSQKNYEICSMLEKNNNFFSLNKAREEIESKIGSFVDAEKDYVDQTEKSLKITEELKTLKNNFDLFEEKISEFRPKKILYESHTENLKELTGKKLINEIRMEELLKQIKELELNSKVEEYEKSIIHLTEKNKELLQKFEDLDIMGEICGDNGIKKFIIGKYLSLLNSICEKYIDTIESEFSIVFNNKKGLNCEIMERGQEIPYRTLSNGQTQQVNLATIFTFIEFLRIKSKTTFPIIFLDEIFDGSLSPEALKIVLDEVKKNIPYVIIISHREPIFETADTLIRVTRTGKFSSYERISNYKGELN